MSGELEKSVPVLKDFWVETTLAPITPGKPSNPNGQTLSNQGDFFMVSKEDGISSQAPVLLTPSLESKSVQQDRGFASRNSIVKETESLANWEAMKFSDLLALSHGLVTPVGGNQASNGGILNRLDSQCQSAPLVSDKQESLGLGGSNRTFEELQDLNQSAEIQQNLEKSRPVITMNLFPHGQIPVFAPATPGHYKSIQGNALSGKTLQDTPSNPDKPNGEKSPVSAIDDLYKEEEEPGGLDLNKTSQQQKPRRKKHRPKVVSEAKPKQRTPKSADNANQTPRQQRKYVSKNKTNIPSKTPPPEMEEVAIDCKIPDRRPFRSCRKTLNFDLEMEAARGCSDYDILNEFGAAMEYEKGRKTKNLTAISSKHEIGLKRANSGSADSQPNYLYFGSAIFGCVQKKRRTEKVVKTNTAHILSFTNALESIRAATSLKNRSREDRGIYFPEICKKRRTEKVLKVNTSHILSFTHALANIREIIRQPIKWGDINKLNKRFIAPILDSKNGFRKHNIPSRSSAKGRGKGTQKRKMITFQASCMEAHPTVNKRRKSRKKKSVAVVNKHSLTLYDDRHFTGNPKGQFLALPWINNTNTTNVDAIIEGMKQLSINNREGSSIVQYQQQNTLIPYRVHRRRQTNALALYRRNGDVIPFEKAQSSKRRERAKVDLDDETNRVWTLLLEDINNQGIDGTDEDKTKWWEEERNVFRGRVDSFIARMRLVQGDRRFSPWKGSVVDSVVGVFLTQNVSDHLSSSAYMSLAARYPLKSEKEVKRDSEEDIGPSVKEADICIVELDENSDNDGKTVEGHIFDRDSRTPSDANVSEEKVVNSKESHGHTNAKDDTLCLSLGNPLYRVSSTKELGVSNTVDNRTIDDVMSSSVSSQNSVESSSAPTLNIGLHNNNSEGEDATNNSSFMELLQLEEKPVLHATCAPIDEVPSCQSDQEEIIDGGTELHLHKKASTSNLVSSSATDNACSSYVLEGEEMVVIDTHRQPIIEQQDTINLLTEGSISPQVNIKLPTVFSGEIVATESSCASISTIHNKLTPTLPLSDHNYSTDEVIKVSKQDALIQKAKKRKNANKASYDWDSLRKQARANGSRQRTANTIDSLDWEAIRCADVNDIANTIRDRGMNNMLAERIKEFLDRLVNDHGSIDLEWLRDVPPDKAKEYLLSVRGLGLKSVECIRLLTLHHLAFPVDTNVGRIAVRLGWVPLQPLPESLQLHLLELYPVLESIQKYLWPRLCKLDQRTLYELHYHMITFGKVFCTKRQPNCNACPLRGECRHFASAFASARLALPGPQDKSIILSNESNLKHQDPHVIINSLPMRLPMAKLTLETNSEVRNCEPIVEIPASPEQEPEETQMLDCDIEDDFSEDPNEIPTIKLNMEEFTQTLQAYMNSNKELQEGDMSKALVALATGAASIPTPKLKNVNRLRTEHHVYELPDTHYLLNGLDKREPDDPCPYLLAIWSPGETANSTEPPEKRCSFEEPGQLCSDETCFNCNSQREANSQIVRGTLLIPCRTAMRGSFPLNGTYFQVNEVFADQDSSLNPIQVPRASLWNLPRRTVYFGTSIPTIFRGLSTEGIQHCFWRGYVCVRGFDQKTRAPRPLMARLHFPASKSKARGKFAEQD